MDMKANVGLSYVAKALNNPEMTKLVHQCLARNLSGANPSPPSP